MNNGSLESRFEINYFLSFIRSKNPKVLLAGCGRKAEDYFSLKSRVESLYGVDLELDEALIDNKKLFRISLTEIARIFKEKFDYIFFYHVLEHVTDYNAVLKSLHFVLKDRGKMFIGTPNKNRFIGYLGSYNATLRDKIKCNLKDYYQRIIGKFENKLGAHAGFNKSELESLLKLYFKITDITVDYYRRKYNNRLISKLFFLYPCLYYWCKK